MGLPKQQYPTFEVKLASMDKPIVYRPFVSKEEKILLIALSGNDKQEMTRAVKQVLTNCVLTPGFDIDKIPSFDLEYLFVVIRSKSVGDVITLSFRGRENTECPVCKGDKTVDVNLNDIKVTTAPEHNKQIELGQNFGVVMRYPSPNQLLDLIELRNNFNLDLQYKLMSECIVHIYDANGVYEIQPENFKEAVTWLEELTSTQFSNVLAFFDTMPHLEHKIDLSCSHCGHEEIFTLSGLESFFW